MSFATLKLEGGQCNILQMAGIPSTYSIISNDPISKDLVWQKALDQQR